VGAAWSGLRQAFYGLDADRLLLVTYESLTGDPQSAMKAIYDFLELPAYPHDFDNVSISAETVDEWLGTPNLHRVRPKVEAIARRTVLPPDLFRRAAIGSFWRDPQANSVAIQIV